jgi:hypothetical protein
MLQAVAAEERRQGTLGIAHPDGRRSDATITMVTLNLTRPAGSAGFGAGAGSAAVGSAAAAAAAAAGGGGGGGGGEQSSCFEIVEWLGAEPRSLSTNTPLDRTRYAEAKQPSTFLRDLILRMSANSALGASMSTPS